MLSKDDLRVLSDALDSYAEYLFAARGRAGYNQEFISLEIKRVEDLASRLDSQPQMPQPVRAEDFQHGIMVQALAGVMSDISEDCYCAGWMYGCEYSIWQAMQKPGDTGYGIGVINESSKALLRLLSQIVDGWVYWDDEKGETYAPMEKWLEMCKRQEPTA